MSPESGYYTTSPKDARARAARIAQRKKAAATPEGKRVIRERLSAKKATARARMTPQERSLADRREVDTFQESRRQQAASGGKATVVQAPVQSAADKKKEDVKKRQEKGSRFFGFGSILDALTPKGKKK